MRNFSIDLSPVYRAVACPLSSDENFWSVDKSTLAGKVSISASSSDLSTFDVASALDFVGVKGLHRETALTIPSGSKRQFDGDQVLEILDLRFLVTGKFIMCTAKAGLIGTARGMIGWFPHLDSGMVTSVSVRLASLSLRGSRRVVWACVDAHVCGVNYDWTAIPDKVDALSTASGVVQDNGSIMLSDAAERRKRAYVISGSGTRDKGLYTLAYPIDTRLGDAHVDVHSEGSALEVFARSFVVGAP